jgi:hypothetical protein
LADHPQDFWVWQMRRRNLSGANAAGIISARKQAALCAVLRSDLRVQRACARPSSPANCLAFLPRSSLGWLFVGFPALQFTKKAFALELLFQDPQCLIDIIITNENFQSGFLSRLNKQVGYKTATPARLGVLPSVHMRAFCRSALHGSPLAIAQARGSRLAEGRRGSEAAVAAAHRTSPISATPRV